jgi:predicted flap endonuclease-1-like 5' DNA nuclease
MPEISVIHIGIITIFAVIGVVIGWVMRGNRCAQEKVAVNTGWQEQIEAQKLEHGRLVDQNKGLMEQINQFQASGKDANNRARELSGALKEAFARRDELQREIKDVRNSLQSAVGERDRLQADAGATAAKAAPDSERKDAKIARLMRELDNWQNRLPPLIERFQQRNEEAKQLEDDLAGARERIEALESMLGSDQTRVEPVNPDVLADGLDASNDDDDEELAEIIDVAADSIAEDLIAVDEILSDEDNDDADELDDEDKADADEDKLVDQLEATDVGQHRDNLKKIKGVGPAIEKTLHELGIFRFTQIASMSEYDIDRIAKRLKGFRTRIYREDWIGQARSLQDAQPSEQA